MLLSRFPFLMRAVLALTLGLALAGAGAAHRPVERPAEAAAEFAAMAAFLAAGGSVDDLCHDAGIGWHGGGHGGSCGRARPGSGAATHTVACGAGATGSC